MNEDCSMFEGAPPTGSHVTIDLDLAVGSGCQFALFTVGHQEAVERCEQSWARKWQFLWNR